MAKEMGRTFVASLEVLRQAVTRPTGFRLAVVAAGWVLTQGSHAVTQALVATGASGVFHHAAFHRFFSRARWDPDAMGHWLFFKLQRILPPGCIHIVVDDTLAAKKGPEIFGLGTHLDPVRSTRKFKVFTFGHVFVTLCVLVQFPFSRSPWALPVLFRLYRQKKECVRNRGAYRTKTRLAHEMLLIFCRWCDRAARIELMADSAFCNDTVTRGLPRNLILIGAMRPDAVLTEAPASRGGRKGGRPRKRGALLPKPAQLAADDRHPWRTCEARIYRRVETVFYKTFVAQWYRACGDRLLRVVVVKCRSGNIPYRVFFAMDPALTVEQILHAYSGRWAIEVLFKNLKQLFGFADSSARTRAAVERTAPFVGLLYTVTVLWYAEHAVTTALAAFPIRPWYPWKSDVCFADVLRAAQLALRGAPVLDLARQDANFTKTRHRVRAARRRAPPPKQLAA